MELRVLGPVELRVEGHCVDIGDGKKLALVVALGIEGGKLLSREIVMERISHDRTINTNTFHSYVSRLRDRLEQLGIERSVLIHRAGTCALDLRADDVDWLRFRRLHDEAMRAERLGDDSTAAARLTEANALWRGEPLTGLSGTWVQGMRETMRRLHQSVLADWGRIALRLQPAEELIGPLTDYAEQYPLNGLLASNLMLALNGAGRTTEAITAYHNLRHRLAEEHGTDPDKSARETYQRLLQETDEGESSPRHPAGSSSRPQHDNLKRDLVDFSGRRMELAQLLSAARSASRTATGIHVISGMPGVGKSVLATHAGHLLREEFPDARLHIDLYGAGERTPKEPMGALYELLAMLDVPAEVVPDSLEQRAALWRDRTAELRALLILDDAHDHEQIRWLLPGGAGCVVLVTSRRRLPDLEGAHDHRLTAPERAAAVQLFATAAGRDPQSEREQHATLVDLCERLPLALRLMANKWRQHPTWTLADLIGQVERARDRIAEIRAGSRSLEAVFQVSLRTLEPSAHMAFLRLGLHPVPEFGAHAAAAVIGEPLERARSSLDELADASLIEEPRPHRFAMHALLADFARGCAETELSGMDQHSVVHRTMDFYLGACAAADRVYSPHRHRFSIATGYPLDLPEMRSRREAIHWFAPEHRTLLSVLSYAAREGGFEPWEAGIVHAFADLLDTHAPSRTAIEVHYRAVGIRRQSGERTGLGHALLDLGRAQLRCGEPVQALTSADEALQHWRRTNDQVGEARALDLIGLVHALSGRYANARGCHEKALELARETNHSLTTADSLEHLSNCVAELGEFQNAIAYFNDAIEIYDAVCSYIGKATAKGNLAGIYMHIGLHREATSLAEEAASIFHDIDDLRNAGRITGNVGEIRAYKGKNNEALQYYMKALDLHRAVHDRAAEINTLCNIGRAHINLDAPSIALTSLHESLRLSDMTSEPTNRAEILVDIGDAYRAFDNWQHAREYYHYALRAARRDEVSYEEARALTGCGHLAAENGERSTARAFFRAAHALMARLGVPEAGALRILMEITDTSADLNAKSR